MGVSTGFCERVGLSTGFSTSRKEEVRATGLEVGGVQGQRYYDGDRALVVELWLYRVAYDLSGLTFQEWDPSVGTYDTSPPVVMLVNSRE